MGKFGKKARIPKNHMTWQSLQSQDNANVLGDIIPANDKDDEEFLQEYKLVNRDEKRYYESLGIQERDMNLTEFGGHPSPPLIGG